jgi:hypothetical protein
MGKKRVIVLSSLVFLLIPLVLGANINFRADHTDYLYYYGYVDTNYVQIPVRDVDMNFHFNDETGSAQPAQGYLKVKLNDDVLKTVIIDFKDKTASASTWNEGHTTIYYQDIDVKVVYIEDKKIKSRDEKMSAYMTYNKVRNYFSVSAYNNKEYFSVYRVYGK